MIPLVEGTQIPLSTVIANPTADADGIVMTFSPGCVYCIFKPTGGAVTVSIGAATPTISVGDATWSPPICFEPDGSTSNTITLTGSNRVCALVGYFNSRCHPTHTISEPA